MYSSNNVNKCVGIFTDKLNYAINMSTTIRTLNSKNKQLKEWMTTGLLCSLRRKQALSLKANKLPNSVKLRSYYIKFKNKFTQILKIRKKNFYSKKLK